MNHKIKLRISSKNKQVSIIKEHFLLINLFYSTCSTLLYTNAVNQVFVEIFPMYNTSGVFMWILLILLELGYLKQKQGVKQTSEEQLVKN